MIPRETIQNIIEAARIEEVVGEFVNLKRRGVNLIGLCPFHNEKTPSFTVNTAKNIFKCFGCGKGGDAVSFLMEHEHYTYPEALRYLAKKYGITVQEEEQTPEMIQQLNEREGLFNVTEFAKNYFTNILHNHEMGRAVGLSYFKERGFSPAIIEKFQLGFCLDEWDAFTKEAVAKGYNPDYLVKTGLSIKRDNGSLYDRFKGRVMFPIHNLSGRAIAFGGRTLITDKAKAAKYVNSPESEIYSKSKVLYGLYLSRTAIVQQDQCLLVEGYTDVISLHQAGVENVVASSGTSLTTEQIKLISRYTKNIVMLYDGDEAGIKASFRGMDMILKEGLNVRVVSFPEGEDPDSFARSHRSEEVQQFINDNAVDFIRYKTNILLKEVGNDPIKKTTLLKDVVNSIALIPDEISRTVYVTECSRILDFPESVLYNEIKKIFRNTLKKQHAELKDIVEEKPAVVQKEETEADLFNTEFIEKEIIRILLMYGNLETDQLNENQEMISSSVKDYIIREILFDEMIFEDPLCAQIFGNYRDAYESSQTVDEQVFFHHDNEQIRTLAIDLTCFPHHFSENWQEKGIYVKKEDDKDKLNQLVCESLLAFKLSKVEKMIADDRNQLKEEKDSDELMIIVSRLSKLERLRITIANLLGRVVTK